ncbi:MAG: preprotein translocase subunit YajC [Lachnospirales bacterium]
MQIFLTADAGQGSSLIMLIAAYVVIFGGLYWFFIRPQKKRENDVKLAQSKIALKDKVVLSTGIYGEVVDIGTDVYIVEIGVNKGVLVPVKKENVFPTEGYKMQ